jgi:hypothetical protein
MTAINRKIFFDRWRLVHGPLAQSAVDALGLFIDHWEGRGGGDLRWLAYAMATAHGEVGKALKPVREGFKDNDAAARAHVAYLLKIGKISRNYALPDAETGHSYYGRGFVQITHKDNYSRLGQALGLDLVNRPDLALEPGVAVRILFTGMERGLFTSLRLASYFLGGKEDWLNARRIINGMDRASEFAALGRGYHAMLKDAVAAGGPLPPPSTTVPEPVVTQPAQPRENTMSSIIFTTVIAPFIRHALTALAVWLVGTGLLSPDQQANFIQILMGAIAGLAGMGWSIADKTKKK